MKDHAGAAQAALAFIKASRQTKEDYFLAASYLAQCLPLAEADPDLSLAVRTLQRMGPGTLQEAFYHSFEVFFRESD